MSQPKQTVHLRKGDFARALNVAERFNVAAGARPNRKVKAVLKEAVEFTAGLVAPLKQGETVQTGSAWSGPDDFLDVKIAQDLARKKDRVDYLTGNVALDVPAYEAKAIEKIRKAFNLSSDKQAAGLAIRVYEKVADGLWRGNGFSYQNPQAPALDTSNVRKTVTGPQTP
ncbi:MAG TPA: hypothetical protein VEF76_02000 [Patescibacteria group bacterium]|nr:hypothetical protein [Patescibacteria group bacterium]